MPQKSRMSEQLSSSVRRDWRSAIDRLAGAYADSTLRAYRSDFSAFDEWCNSIGQVALPAEPETVAAFIEHDAIMSSPATLRRRLAGIRKIHRLLRLENPVDDEDVAIAMRRALRTKPRRQKQALGLTRALRDQLIASCSDTLPGKRDRALIAVGYDTLCRRSELISLRKEDLSPLENGAMSILVTTTTRCVAGARRARRLARCGGWLRAHCAATGWGSV